MKVKPKKPIKKPTPEMEAAIKAQQDYKMPKEVVDAINNMGKPKKKKCFWPWNHDWQNWKTIEQGKIQNVRYYFYRGEHEKIDTGNYKVQERICNNCGKIDIYTLTTTIND